MFKQQIKEVNDSLKRTNKAIVAIGCSFVQGQGAVNDELYGHFKWEMRGLGKPLEIVITEKEKKILLAKYPELRIQDGKIDFTFMEYKILRSKLFHLNFS